MSTFVFRNGPFQASMDRPGGEIRRLTPEAFYDFPNRCLGVLVRDGDESVASWSTDFPVNLVTMWRATEVLRAIRVIKLETSLRDAVFTATRKSSRSKPPWMHRSKSLISEIGKAEFDRIMSLRIPEEIIRGVLENWSMSYGPDPSLLFEEILANTISWDLWKPEFRDAGISDPRGGD